MNRLFFVTAICWTGLFGVTCNHQSAGTSGDDVYSIHPDAQVVLSAKPAKWFDNHTCAVSITCDIPVTFCNEVVNEVLDRSLTCDLEMSTIGYADKNKELFRYVESFYSRGIHFFGHGHEHWFFDTMKYEVAFAMFDTCYRFMRSFNIGPPLAYAYPYGAGNRLPTQRAVKNAGFICSRGVAYNIDTFIQFGKMYDPEEFFICSGDTKEPSNWFDLPSVCVGRDVPRWVNHHGHMAEMFTKNQERTAWMIILYHSIGMINEEGYYPMEDFKKDLDALAASDVWVVNIDVIARYILERNLCTVSSRLTEYTDDACTFSVTVDDSLAVDYPKVPLTMLFDIAGDTVLRCEVQGADTCSAVTVTDGRFSLDVVPSSTPFTIRLFRKK